MKRRALLIAAALAFVSPAAFAGNGLGISQLPPGGNLQPGDILPADRGGVTYSVVNPPATSSSTPLYQYEQLVSTGLTATTTNDATNVLWNSATVGIKTDTIPQPTGSGKIITITDVLGTAGNSGNYIVAVPVSGTVIGNPFVYSNYGSITLFDSKTLAQWVSQ